MNHDLRGERDVVERNDATDETGAVFYQCEGGVDTRRDNLNLGGVVRRRVRETGRKLRKRTWSSAGQSHRARSAGASEKQVENSERGPRQARARAIGRGGAREMSLIPSNEVGVHN